MYKEPCLEAAEEFLKNFDKSPVDNVISLEEQTYEYAWQVIYDYLDLLGAGEDVSVMTVWDCVQKLVKPFYSKANGHYQELLKKIEGKPALTEISNYLSNPEQGFYDVFKSLQSSLRRLSQPDTPDF